MRLLIPRLHPALPALAAALLAACGGDPGARRPSTPADSSVSVVDDAGRTVTLPHPARRIVALVPAVTETVIALGAAERLVGRTDYDKGAAVERLPSVGGGLDPSIEKLVSLHPDVVLGWETSGRTELRDRLTALGIPVFSVKTEDTTDVFRSLRNLGRLTARERAADSVAASIRGELDAVRASVAGAARPSVFFVVWNDPPMTAGPRTFVSHVIEVAGGRNAFADQRALWPNVSLEEIVRRQPDFVVVPVGEQGTVRLEALKTAVGWRELRAVREGRIVTVPAQVVNQPGPHLARAARAMRDAIHPEIKGR
ncbi:MAG TPA: cobalamin-binding protein [Longimicrobium sp.]|nr:cobalamin-binding protein [Longimicrobium sp.]